MPAPRTPPRPARFLTRRRTRQPPGCTLLKARTIRRPHWRRTEPRRVNRLSRRERAARPSGQSRRSQQHSRPPPPLLQLDQERRRKLDREQRYRCSPRLHFHLLRRSEPLLEWASGRVLRPLAGRLKPIRAAFQVSHRDFRPPRPTPRCGLAGRRRARARRWPTPLRLQRPRPRPDSCARRLPWRDTRVKFPQPGLRAWARRAVLARRCRPSVARARPGLGKIRSSQERISRRSPDLMAEPRTQIRCTARPLRSPRGKRDRRLSFLPRCPSRAGPCASRSVRRPLTGLSGRRQRRPRACRRSVLR